MVTQIWINIGSRNGFLPDDTMPLPEPMLIPHQSHLPEGNFTASAEAIILYNEYENSTFKITTTSPRDKWVEADTLRKCCLVYKSDG